MFRARPELSIPDRPDDGAILVADAERSRAFYVGGLGLTEVPRPANFDFPGFWVAVGDQQLHVIGEAEPGRVRSVHTGYGDEEPARGHVIEIMRTGPHAAGRERGG
jgi:catechol 2,3-dioxygenase-like lactoylglutathione lyase family enzyme